MGLHSTVIDPFSGCDFGFGLGFGSDCGCGYHSWAIDIFRGPCLDMVLFLFLAVMETGRADSPRVPCSLVVELLSPSLGEWRHP